MILDDVSDVLARWGLDVDVVGASFGVRRSGRDDVFAAWGQDGANAMPCEGSFRIASVTKTFTSALVLRLIDSGDLSLDDTIERWFPDYPHGEGITIRSLLQHTSGTADLMFDALDDYTELLLGDLERVYSPLEVVDLTAALPPHAPPDRSYRYSNTDYILLGALAEQVCLEPFATLITREFAAPLGLTDTGYDLGVPDDLLHGWFGLNSDGQPDPARHRELDVRDFPNSALISLAYSAGGMTSTLRDLLSWGEALYVGPTLSRSSTDRLLASPEFGDPDGGCHGLGVFAYGSRRPDGSWPAYGHTGNIIGSSTFLGTFPSATTTTTTIVAIHGNVLEVPSAKLVELGFALAKIHE
ncbi:MAG: serine hydrolase domain-containing protein [Ilumatobacteraceae bacterium]